MAGHFPSEPSCIILSATNRRFKRAITAIEDPKWRKGGTIVRSIIPGAAILLAFLGLGEIVSYISGLPVPGNVLGMILLAAALAVGLVPLSSVERVADWLLDHLGLFFVPPGVGVMLHWGLIRREWFPILAAFLVSTFAVLAVTGLVARGLSRSEPTP